MPVTKLGTTTGESEIKTEITESRKSQAKLSIITICISAATLIVCAITLWVLLSGS